MSKTKRQSDDMEKIEQIRSRQKNVIKSIERIKQSVYDKTISFNPNELECWLDILKAYIDTTMSLQSDLDVYNPTNDDRVELVDICLTTKSLFLSMITKNRKTSLPETQGKANRFAIQCFQACVCPNLVGNIRSTKTS